jgi:hypothetical protein
VATVAVRRTRIFTGVVCARAGGIHFETSLEVVTVAVRRTRMLSGVVCERARARGLHVETSLEVVSDQMNPALLSKPD